MSCIGNGYLSGNRLISFPFEDGQSIAWADRAMELQRALEACFVDAIVYVPSQSVSDGEWPVIGNFSVSDNILTFVVGIGGHIETVSVAPSTVAFPIVTATGSWGAFAIVLSSEDIAGFCKLINEFKISPPVQAALSSSSERVGAYWLRLCAKCVNLQAMGLQSIRVFDGQLSNNHTLDNGPHYIIKGDVTIRSGNNILLEEPDNAENGFELNAIPGAGLGRLPCVCEDVAGGNALLAGPDGHARLFNDTCYDIEPITDAGIIQLHVKCTACCTCSMYESLVNRLAVLAGSIRDARRLIREHLQTYESAVKRFNDRLKSASVEDVKLSLSGMPIGGNLSPKIKNTRVSGRMSRCAFTAVVRNASYFEILATVGSMSGTDSIVESSASWSLEDGTPQSSVSDSSLSGRTFSIFPGRSLVLTFVSMKSERVSSVLTGGFSGSVSVNMSYRDANGTVKRLGTISRTVEV